MLDDACQPHRNVLLRLAERRRFSFQDRAHGIGSSVAVESTFAADHFVQDGAQAKNVGTGIRSLSPNLFG